MRKTIWLLLVLIAAFNCRAAINDSVYDKLVKEGRAEFCNVLDGNDCALAANDISKMQFVVDVGGDQNYSFGYTMNGSTTHSATTSPLKDSINSWIRSMYQQYHLEFYLLFINTLDVEIKTPIPDSAKVRDLFMTSLYDDVGNTREMEQLHEELALKIVGNVITPQHRDCIILSTAQFQGAFKGDGKISLWSFSKLFKHIATERTFTGLEEVYSDFYRRIQSDQSCSSDLPEVSARAYVDELRGTLKSHELRGLILNTLHPDPLKLILVQFNYPQDYTDLTLEQRKHILSVFSGYSMLADYFGNTGEERYTIKVVSTTPKNQIEGLLTVLSQPSYLNDNPNYLGNKGNNALIYVLMYRIDDSYWSEDNDYTKFVKAISDLMMSDETVIANHLPSTDEQWMQRKINWGGTTSDGVENIGYQKYDVNMYSNGSVQVSAQIVSSWNSTLTPTLHGPPKKSYTAVWNSNGDFTLNPFDLVFFTNRSNVSMLQEAGAAPNSVKAVPAIFMKYADDKDFDQAVTSAVTSTIYFVGTTVGVLATGGALVTAIEAADFALAAYTATQFIGVTGQLAADAIGNPALKNVMLAYNSIIGIWGVGELLANTSQMSGSLLTAAKSGTLKQIPEGTAEAFRADYSQAESDLEQLDPAVKEKLDRMEEYLGEGVELNELLARREAYINNLKALYGELDFEGFNALGVNEASVNNEIKQQMMSQLIEGGMSTNNASAKLTELISSGSTQPQKILCPVGTKLYKFNPIGRPAPLRSYYWLTKDQLDELMQTNVIYEQKCAIPLGSIAEQYDIYEITVTEDTYVFESKIAAISQRNYQASGGAQQSLVLDKTKWSTPTLYQSEFTPNY